MKRLTTILALLGALFGIATATLALTSGDNALAGAYKLYAPALSRDEPAAVTTLPPSNTATPTSTTTAATPSATSSPTATATTAAAGTTITSLTSPIKRGNMASLTAHTSPGAYCSITYITPSGTTSTAAGLFAQYADGAGNVTWTWLISGNTNPGTGSVTVYCGSQVATASITITTA